MWHKNASSGEVWTRNIKESFTATQKNIFFQVCKNWIGQMWAQTRIFFIAIVRVFWERWQPQPNESANTTTGHTPCKPWSWGEMNRHTGRRRLLSQCWRQHEQAASPLPELPSPGLSAMTGSLIQGWDGAKRQWVTLTRLYDRLQTWRRETGKHSYCQPATNAQRIVYSWHGADH